LRLDYHLDDSIENCLDVLADSTAKIIHVSPDPKEAASSRRLGIACVSGIGQALDILEQATMARDNPSLLRKLSSIVGWRL
jgi:thiamine pyrophosphate-dependent acetolactate synthase large subunit-like protein